MTAPVPPAGGPPPNAFTVLIKQAKDALHHFTGSIAVFFWLLKALIEYLWIRFNVGRWAHFIVLGYLVFLVVEIVLHYRGVEVLAGGSLAAQVVFVAVLLISSVVHFRGWRERIQQVFFIEAARQIAGLLSKAQFDQSSSTEAIDQLMGIFCGNFADKGAVSVNIFLYDAAADGLTFSQSYPAEAQLDRQFVFRSGSGGAGVCFGEKRVVYIPWRRFGYALMINVGTAERSAPGAAPGSRVSDFQVIPRCYVPDTVQAFESVLTVPILFSGKCYGVLNLDSARPNAFGVRDFPQALFYGMVMGLYFHEFAQSGGVAHVPGNS